MSIPLASPQETAEDSRRQVREGHHLSVDSSVFHNCHLRESLLRPDKDVHFRRLPTTTEDAKPVKCAVSQLTFPPSAFGDLFNDALSARGAPGRPRTAPRATGRRTTAAKMKDVQPREPPVADEHTRYMDKLARALVVSPPADKHAAQRHSVTVGLFSDPHDSSVPVTTDGTVRRWLQHRHTNLPSDQQRPPYGKLPGAPAPRSGSAVSRLRRCKFRPYSAPYPATRRLSADTTGSRSGDERDDGTASEDADASGASAQLPFVQQALAEPVHSYAFVRHVSGRVPPHIPRGMRYALSDGSAVARANLAHFHENFEHQRYAKHAELEDFQRFRDSCKDVVCARTRAASTSDDAARARETELLRKYRRKHPVIPIATQHNARRARQPLRCAWTDRVYQISMEEERQALAKQVESYELTIEAPAISAQKMRELQRCVVAAILRKSPRDAAQPLFSRWDFTLLLLSQGLVKDHFPRGGGSEPLRREDIEAIVDGLPSTAEAAFVAFVYQTLPY